MVWSTGCRDADTRTRPLLLPRFLSYLVEQTLAPALLVESVGAKHVKSRGVVENCRAFSLKRYDVHARAKQKADSKLQLYSCVQHIYIYIYCSRCAHAVYLSVRPSVWLAGWLLVCLPFAPTVGSLRITRYIYTIYAGRDVAQKYRECHSL